MLELVRNGIVRVAEGGEVCILRPGKNGGRLTHVSVSPEITDTFRLATGDVVEGETEPIESEESLDGAEEYQEEFTEESQRDESSPRSSSDAPLLLLREPTERLISVQRINGLIPEEAEERPFPKTRRSHTERTRPDRQLPIAIGPHDTTGRMLDFAAPLGLGDMGAIYGPHGSGLTRTLRTLLQGAAANVPDCVVIVLMIQARGEEVTDLRRRFPYVDIVVCPVGSAEIIPDEALLLPMLLLETAQRQTELGKDVVLLIDSLTAFWGMLLETEEATAQREADQSQARQRILEFVRKAGCFHGETPLGGSLGGSLTLIGTVWHQQIDIDAEEDHELHPHLRLLEQIIPDLNWRAPLHAGLAAQRLYPAIDLRACLSQNEASFLPAETIDSLLTARAKLPRNDPFLCYNRVMDALDQTTESHDLIDQISAS